MDKATWVGGPKDGQPVTAEEVARMADGPLLTWRHEHLVAEVQRLRREVHPAVVAHKARIAALEAAVDALLQQGTFHLERIHELEAALAALVAKEPTFGTDTGLYCVACDAEQLSFVEPFVHEPDCPWIKARTLREAAERETNDA